MSQSTVPEYGIKSYKEVSQKWAKHFSCPEFTISWETLNKRTQAEDPKRKSEYTKKLFTGKHDAHFKARFDERSA